MSEDNLNKNGWTLYDSMQHAQRREQQDCEWSTAERILADLDDGEGEAMNHSEAFEYEREREMALADDEKFMGQKESFNEYADEAMLKEQKEADRVMFEEQKEAWAAYEAEQRKHAQSAIDAIID